MEGWDIAIPILEHVSIAAVIGTITLFTLAHFMGMDVNILVVTGHCQVKEIRPNWDSMVICAVVMVLVCQCENWLIMHIHHTKN